MTSPALVGLPSIATTVIVTAIAGIFGLIPAAIHSGRAESLGYSGAAYWKAFWVTLLVQAAMGVGFWLLLLLMLSRES